MGSFQRITLKDIAKDAGVSHVTVSLALRNHKSIPLTTRERIKVIAKRMGYRPDPVLSALNTYRLASQAVHYQANLALIEFGAEGSVSLTAKPQTEYFYFWTGAQNRAQELGYKLEVFKVSDLDIGAQRLSRLLYRRQIQGVFLAPLPPSAASLNLDWKNFSTVAFGFSHQTIFDTHIVCSSQYRNARQAVRKLREYGYKRIGFLTWRDIDWRTDLNFSSGFWAEQTSAGYKVAILDLEKEARFSDNASIIKEWIRKNKPDVILTPSSALVSPVLEKLGFSIPEDMAVATLSYVPTEPAWAGIDQLPQLSGKAAVDLMTGLLQRNERGIPESSVRVLIDGSWTDGHSVCKRKSAESKKIGE